MAIDRHTEREFVGTTKVEVAPGCTCGTTGRGYCPVHMLTCCREEPKR